MNRVQRLRELLAAPGLEVMPCCYDALSAKLIERAGFPLTFMSGFAVSVARLGARDEDARILQLDGSAFDDLAAQAPSVKSSTTWESLP